MKRILIALCVALASVGAYAGNGIATTSMNDGQASLGPTKENNQNNSDNSSDGLGYWYLQLSVPLKDEGYKYGGDIVIGCNSHIYKGIGLALDLNTNIQWDPKFDMLGYVGFGFGPSYSFKISNKCVFSVPFQAVYAYYGEDLGSAWLGRLNPSFILGGFKIGGIYAFGNGGSTYGVSVGFAF